MKPLFFLFILALISACSKAPAAEQAVAITNPADYEKYLASDVRPSFAKAQEAFNFWNARLAPDTSGIGELGKIAAAYTALFSATGKPQHLHDAEAILRKAVDISAHNSPGYTLSLAANLISQHRFSEAKQLLDNIAAAPKNEVATDYVRYDVLMEVGNYAEARAVLGRLTDKSDFAWLIRMAKWDDHMGRLDSAIDHLEQAMAIADRSKNEALQVWSYSNIADFYGHAGRIKDSYRYYLKTLAIEPDNAYAKRGIAWIAYAHDDNPREAQRILDSILVTREAPDYHLFLAELAEYQGDEQQAQHHHAAFAKTAHDPLYGGMYHTHLVEHLLDRNPAQALSLAKEELDNRDTPEVRQLLAQAQLAAGDAASAKTTIDTYVAGKTVEPTAALASAKVYAANGETTRLPALLAELHEAAYELGPLTMREVEGF